ncbi:MAG TPA: hypothetical protein VFZ00_06670 [Solirubrobacter sp.]|nr:hypothetical protein [Solirubrobacter sp.]
MVAVLVGALILLVLVLLVRACNDRRHKDALRNYNVQVSGIATESRQNGAQFFEAMNQGGSTAPQDLYQQIVGFKNSAEKTLEQAKRLDVPDDMRSAHESLLIALELRRDGLTKIAEEIKTALGDEGDAADEAIRSIAGQMRSFDASDVLYQSRVTPFIRKALQDANAGTDIQVQPSQFMRDINWVSDAYVASKLGQQLSTGGDGGDEGGGDQTTGPGLHGTGLDATSYGQQTLQPGGSNRLTYVQGQAFTVSFTNQGDNDEFNIKVTIKIERASGGSPITISKTVSRVAKGEKATVTLPLNREPPLDTAVNITTTVAAVPGEKTKDNNTAEYPSVFVAG